MTHLEDLWAQFPSSKPPAAAIVRAARKHAWSRPDRRVTFAAAATVAAGAVVATAVLSTGGGSAPGGGSDATAALSYEAFQADLKPASSCDSLLASYRQRAMPLVGAYGWNTYRRYYSSNDQVTLGSAVVPDSLLRQGALTSLPPPAPQGAPINGAIDAAGSASAANGAKLLGQANSATGTNVQEIGVDEPDSVKTNGTLIARLNGNTLAVYDASGSTVRARGTLALPYFGGGSILMSGTTVIASGLNTDPAANGGTRVGTISLADPDHPTITSTVVYAGGNVTALRQQGSVVRMVMSSGLPQLKFVSPEQGKRTTAQAQAINQHVVATSTLKDWLPTYDAGSGAQQLQNCTDVAIPPATVALGTTSITSFDIGTPTNVSAIGVAGVLSNAYESQHNLYLTVGPDSGGCIDICPMGAARPCCFGGGTGPTTILQFHLDGVRTSHVATGHIQGWIRNSWSMDEWQGILRVTSTRYGRAGQENVVETMVPHGDRLVRQGLLTGLGQNQTMTAARWFDNLAIISTTQQVDPLYTIDLTDPRHPRTLGALHLPGQTQYIHPLSATRFLTISLQDVDQPSSYSQVATFDTHDLARVRQLSRVSAGQNTYSLAGNDPRMFTWLPDRSTALTSFSGGPDGLFLGEYRVAGGGRLTQTKIPLRSGDEGPRTFEVANGKVVLISGGTVQFLSM